MISLFSLLLARFCVWRPCHRVLYFNGAIPFRGGRYGNQVLLCVLFFPDFRAFLRVLYFYCGRFRPLTCIWFLGVHLCHVLRGFLSGIILVLWLLFLRFRLRCLRCL